MRKRKKIILYVLLFLLLYFGLTAYDKIYYHQIDQKLATFDLNNDGVFSLEEQTPEQRKYDDIAIGTYRGIFPIIELFRSLLITGLAVLVLEAGGYIVKRKKDKN